MVREFQYGDSFFYIIRIWRAILPQILQYDQNKSKADCLGQFFLAFDESALFINFRMRNLSTAKGTKCTKTTKNVARCFFENAKSHLWCLIHWHLNLITWLKTASKTIYPANIYLSEFNNRNSRKRCEICSKLTVKIVERHHWRHSGVFIVNSKHILHIFLVFLLMTLNK